MTPKNNGLEAKTPIGEGLARSQAFGQLIILDRGRQRLESAPRGEDVPAFEHGLRFSQRHTAAEGRGGHRHLAPVTHLNGLEPRTHRLTGHQNLNLQRNQRLQSGGGQIQKANLQCFIRNRNAAPGPRKTNLDLTAVAGIPALQLLGDPVVHFRLGQFPHRPGNPSRFRTRPAEGRQIHTGQSERLDHRGPGKLRPSTDRRSRSYADAGQCRDTLNEVGGEHPFGPYQHAAGEGGRRRFRNQRSGRSWRLSNQAYHSETHHRQLDSEQDGEEGLHQRLRLLA